MSRLWVDVTKPQLGLASASTSKGAQGIPLITIKKCCTASCRREQIINPGITLHTNKRFSLLAIFQQCRTPWRKMAAAVPLCNANAGGM
jgi:hypothetical protein